MPASSRMASPSATSVPPIQLASTGLPAMLGVRHERAGGGRRIGHRLRRQDDQQAVGVRVVGGDLERLRRTARARRRRGCRSGCCGSRRRAGRRSAPPSSPSESSVSSPPPPMSASVASTPGPPALVTIVRRRPAGRGCLARISATYEQLVDRIDAQHAARRKAASSTSSLAGQRAGVRGGGLGRRRRCGRA